MKINPYYCYIHLRTATKLAELEEEEQYKVLAALKIFVAGISVSLGLTGKALYVLNDAKRRAVYDWKKMPEFREPEAFNDRVIALRMTTGALKANPNLGHVLHQEAP